jgi:hypothetical protein
MVGCSRDRQPKRRQPRQVARLACREYRENWGERRDLNPPTHESGRKRAPSTASWAVPCPRTRRTRSTARSAVDAPSKPPCARSLNPLAARCRRGRTPRGGERITNRVPHRRYGEATSSFRYAAISTICPRLFPGAVAWAPISSASFTASTVLCAWISCGGRGDLVAMRTVTSIGPDDPTADVIGFPFTALSRRRPGDGRPGHDEPGTARGLLTKGMRRRPRKAPCAGSLGPMISMPVIAIASAELERPA